MTLQMPAIWYTQQQVKASKICVQAVHLHGTRRTRKYLIERELLRCELAETLDELEEQLEEVVEALMELDVFVAVDALIDQAASVGKQRQQEVFFRLRMLCFLCLASWCAGQARCGGCPPHSS